MSVNFSPRQFRRTNFVGHVMESVQRAGVSPSRVQIEITETAIFDDAERAAETLYKLRQMGFRIALDDFGTGYSSLYNIRKFALDSLKIDRSFIDGMGRERESAAIVHAIIHLGHALGLEVIAEGVETEAPGAVTADRGGQPSSGLFLLAPRRRGYRLHPGGPAVHRHRSRNRPECGTGHRDQRLMPTVQGRLQPLVRPTSLGAKLVVILTLVGLAGALGITLLLASVITPSFAKLEDKAIADMSTGHARRCPITVPRSRGAVRDYGDWNDSYDYMTTPSAKFERDSFSPLAMSNLGVQGMAYVTPDGRIVIARWLDAKTGAENPALRAAFLRSIARTDLSRAIGRGSSARYYAPLGPVVVSIGVAKIRKSDGSGAARGHVLMARIITPKQLSDLLQVNARIDPALGTADVVNRGASTMAIAVPILGADGQAVASARFSVGRDVSLLGRRMLLLAIAGSTLLLLIVLMVLRRMIASQVLQPLHRVERHMQKVRALGTLGPLDEDGRRDEIGSLGRSFNAMLLQLNDLRGQVEVQSFALGRSESAVAVMHNVRNALNPISTILSQGVAQGPPVDRTTLDRALSELAKDDIPAGRRPKLAAFRRRGNRGGGGDACRDPRRTAGRARSDGACAGDHRPATGARPRTPAIGGLRRRRDRRAQRHHRALFGQGVDRVQLSRASLPRDGEPRDPEPGDRQSVR